MLWGNIWSHVALPLFGPCDLWDPSRCWRDLKEWPPIGCITRRRSTIDKRRDWWPWLAIVVPKKHAHIIFLYVNKEKQLLYIYMWVILVLWYLRLKIFIGISEIMLGRIKHLKKKNFCIYISWITFFILGKA